MSRIEIPVNKTTEICTGNDHAIGLFVDVRDSWYAKSGKDEQGEGYLVEWSKLFGFSQNKIGVKVEELKDDKRIIELVDKFIEVL